MAERIGIELSDNEASRVLERIRKDLGSDYRFWLDLWGMVRYEIEEVVKSSNEVDRGGLRKACAVKFYLYFYCWSSRFCLLSSC